MSITIVFPGQGSQYVGMGEELVQSFPEAKALFDEANERLGRDISDICFNGPEDVLTKTENAQVGLFLVSSILFQQLKKNEISPSYLMGHSLGEITAYYASGAIDLQTALDIVVARGQFMSEYSEGTMAAILGTDLNNLETELLEFESDNIVIANYNSSGQYVISGSKEGVQKACEKCSNLDNVKRVVPLKVGGPFHSPIMKPAAEKFEAFIADKDIQDSSIPLILNRTALTETFADKLKENLPLQIKSSVKWQQSIEKVAPSTSLFIECGPGKVLTALIKKIVKGKSIATVNDKASLESIIEELS